MSAEDPLFSAIHTFVNTPRDRVVVDTSPSDPDLRRRARMFADREEAIVGRMLALDRDTDQEGFTVFSEVVDLEAATKVSLRADGPALPVGLGVTDISLDHYLTAPNDAVNPIVYAPRFTEVITPTVLRIGKHMDEETQVQVEQLLRAGNIKASDLFTLLLFDTNGTYAQVSAYPRSVIENTPRHDLGSNDIPVKLALTPFTQRNANTVDDALRVLEAFKL